MAMLVIDIIVIIFLPQPPPTPPHLCLCQAINREMAPEYTDDQEEGEQICSMTCYKYIKDDSVIETPKKHVLKSSGCYLCF